jgi:hypothetical protein
MSNFNTGESGMFSFGVREMRIARAAQSPGQEGHKERRAELRLLHKPAKEKLGCDPYNTSGSFDRKNNWARVGKR